MTDGTAAGPDKTVLVVASRSDNKLIIENVVEIDDTLRDAWDRYKVEPTHIEIYGAENIAAYHRAAIKRSLTRGEPIIAGDVKRPRNRAEKRKLVSEQRRKVRRG